MFLRYYLFSKQAKTLYLNPLNIINGGENIRKLSILLIFLLLVIVIPAVSAEENVTSDNIDNSITIGPEDSIQTAVNDANSPATIYLTPGTYYQNGIKVDKNLTFQGKGNAEDIIIDGQHKDSIILINSVSTVKFINITFINSDGHDYGGAIHSEHGGKVYADTCIFKDNKANENGRAISVAGEQFYKLGKKLLTKDDYIRTS